MISSVIVNSAFKPTGVDITKEHKATKEAKEVPSRHSRKRPEFRRYISRLLNESLMLHACYIALAVVTPSVTYSGFVSRYSSSWITLPANAKTPYVQTILQLDHSSENSVASSFTLKYCTRNYGKLKHHSKQTVYLSILELCSQEFDGYLELQSIVKNHEIRTPEVLSVIKVRPNRLSLLVTKTNNKTRDTLHRTYRHVYFLWSNFQRANMFAHVWSHKK